MHNSICQCAELCVATLCRYGSAKIKEAMIFLIADIVGTCFDANYKVSKRHVMPLLGQVLGDVKHKSVSICALFGRWVRVYGSKKGILCNLSHRGFGRIVCKTGRFD